MKFCTECGTVSKDTAKFCEKCGARFDTEEVLAADGVQSAEAQYDGQYTVTSGTQAKTQAKQAEIPAAGMEEITERVAEEEAAQLRSYFNIKPKDPVIASVGNSFLQNLLAGGVVKKTVACFTPSRLYYQGCTYSGKKKSREVTSGSVLLKDITYTGISHSDPVGGKIFSIILTAWIALATIVGAIQGSADGTTLVLGPVIGGLLCAASWYFLYFRKKFTAFRIDFPGSGIVFNMRYYSQEEVTLFKDTITRCVDIAKGI